MPCAFAYLTLSMFSLTMSNRHSDRYLLCMLDEMNADIALRGFVFEVFVVMLFITRCLPVVMRIVINPRGKSRTTVWIMVAIKWRIEIQVPVFLYKINWVKTSVVVTAVLFCLPFFSNGQNSINTYKQNTAIR